MSDMDPEGETNVDRRRLYETMHDRGGKVRKRCLSVSPAHGLQCEKLRKHNKTDQGKPVHMHGSVIWGAGSPSVRTLADSLQEMMQKGLRDFTVPAPPTVDPGVLARLSALPDFNIRIDGRFDNSPMLAELMRKYLNDRMDAAPLSSDGEAVGIKTAAEMPEVEPLTLDEWWSVTAEDEIARTVPKVQEYGATDLRDTGYTLARTMGREVTEEEAIELGIFFYLVGKMSRWQSAVERGDRPSDDTLFDIGVYVRMAQRTRHSGTFPGPMPEPEQEPCVTCSGMGCADCQPEQPETKAGDGDVPPSRLLTDHFLFGPSPDRPNPFWGVS